MAIVSCIQKCAGVLISTVTYFSIAAARFSLPIGSELKFSNCLAFLYAVLELLKLLSFSSTDLLIKLLLTKNYVYVKQNFIPYIICTKIIWLLLKPVLWGAKHLFILSFTLILIRFSFILTCFLFILIRFSFSLACFLLIFSLIFTNFCLFWL